MDKVKSNIQNLLEVLEDQGVGTEYDTIVDQVYNEFNTYIGSAGEEAPLISEMLSILIKKVGAKYYPIIVSIVKHETGVSQDSSLVDEPELILYHRLIEYGYSINNSELEGRAEKHTKESIKEVTH